MISCAKLAQLGVVLPDPPATRGDYVSHVVPGYSDCCAADDWKIYLRKPLRVRIRRLRLLSVSELGPFHWRPMIRVG